MSNSFTARPSQEPIRVKNRGLFNYSARNFCSKPESEEPKKESGFSAYLKKLVQVDNKVKDQKSDVDKNLESILTKDPSEIKIGFHRIKSNITLDSIEDSAKPAPVSEVVNQVQVQQRVQSDEDKLVEIANKKFGVSFFKDFALSDLKMTRVSLEEYLRDMPNKDETPLFVTSMLNNAYTLNSWIPNCHKLFYDIFCSPSINKDERKQSDSTDILVGNLFEHEVSNMGYKSLLHSALLSGKKKHFKKILAHIDKW